MRNAGRHLPEFLSSLRRQKFTDFEAIIVDDHSSDSSLDIAMESARLDDRIIPIRLADGGSIGAANARRIGFNESSGEIICFLDSDDVTNPNLFHEISDAFVSTDPDVLIFQYRRISPKGKVLGILPEGLSGKVPGLATHSDEALRETLFQITNPALWNKAWRRHLVEKVEPFMGSKLKWANDLPLTYGMLALAQKVCLLEKVLYSYRVSSSSSSSLRGLIPNNLPEALIQLGQMLCLSGHDKRLEGTFHQLVELELNNHFEFLAMEWKCKRAKEGNRRS